MKRLVLGVGLVVLLYVGIPLGATQVWGADVQKPLMAGLTIAIPVLALPIMERRRGAHPSVVTVVAVLAASASIAWVFFLVIPESYLLGFLLSVVVSPVAVWANKSYIADVRRAQQRREELATNIVDMVRSGEAAVPPFVLYLRPFESTDRLWAEALPMMYESSSRFPANIDLETLLARTLRDYCSFLALGRSGEMVEGAARVTVPDSRWFEVIQMLARRARFLTMIPLARPSTTRELSWLAEQRLLAKVLMIMPETLHETPSGVIHTYDTGDRIFRVGIERFEPSKHTLNLAREWADGVQAASELGLELPPLASVGSLFTLDAETGRVRRILPLAISHFAHPQTYLRSVINALQLYDFGVSSANDPFEAFDAAVGAGGKTLEYALVRAADGYVQWGDLSLAVASLRKAVSRSRGRRAIVTNYVNSLAEYGQKCLDGGDRRAAERYFQAARVLHADPQFARFVKQPPTRASHAAM